MIIKVLIAVPFVMISKKSEKLLNVKSALFTVLGGAITILGYFVTDLIVYREGAVADLPANVIQAVGSAVVFLILAFALDRADIKTRFKKEIEK